MGWGKKKICGIYAIKLDFDGKEIVYVGYSINIKKRWNHHRYHLNQNKHCNSLLQEAWNRHGKESFKFTILKKLHKIDSIDELLELEKEYANFYGYGDPKKCFNIGEPGNVHAPRNTTIGGVCCA